jgi:hypothetical protein
MPPTRRTDNRRYTRRAKSIRFRFDHAGDQHRAVSTVVSLGGAFLRASHIPKSGTVLNLLERFNPDGVDIAIRCEVVWLQDEPSLERPDTGFGVRFVEAVTRADPSNLEDFLRGLDPTLTSFDISFEERANGAFAVYRFPSVDIDPSIFRDDEHGFADLDEPAIIDLDRELERLGREERRIADEGSRPGSWNSPAFPPPVPPASSPAAPVGARTDSQTSPLPTGSPAPAVATAAERGRKKRRVTGIFTALFSRGAKPAQAPSPAVDPTSSTKHTSRIPDERRPKVQVTCAGQSIVGHLETLTREGATLWATDMRPDEGMTILLRPVGAPPTIEPLAIVATVASVSAAPDHHATHGSSSANVTWLSVTFIRVEEQGRPGRFHDYLRLVNGPGEGE